MKSMIDDIVETSHKFGFPVRAEEVKYILEMFCVKIMQELAKEDFKNEKPKKVY